MSDTKYTWGLGRRKSSVARVRLIPGAGGFVVNGKPMTTFFPVLANQESARSPLVTADLLESYDIFCNVNGGGVSGQAGAVRLGIARALVKLDPALDPTFRVEGHLTRDSRMKERKKPGQRGARRGFQFSKR